jgi:hypothetical protein
MKYRRNVDGTYEPVAEVLAIIAGTYELDRLADLLNGLKFDKDSKSERHHGIHQDC